MPWAHGRNARPGRMGLRRPEHRSLKNDGNISSRHPHTEPMLRPSISRACGARGLATAAQIETLSKYPVGLSVHGYVIDQVQPIPEFSVVAVKLKHTKTGSEHLHLDVPHDKNNVFLVAFKTNPPNNTGVPHILEHTTLCGSYKYPVRDPFFKMLNRSLSNFMNAMTGHDYTFYPFATTNQTDFQNLMDVYLSSVFEPLLTYEDFSQEGWRLEQSDLEDSKSDLTFKGVVYNEMKGQYSNSSYYFYIKFQESVYPSLKNSGGDPINITDLHYEDLVDFHSTNYHPSNSKTFTYGALPLNNHLEKLNDYFKGFGGRSTKPIVRKPLFASTHLPDSRFNVTIKGPVDTMSNKPIDEQYQSSITWSLGNPLEEGKQYEVFKWKILSSLLCDGHNSPFYQELIETEFGDDFSVNTGFDTTTALMSFTMGLNNLSLDKVNALEAKINDIFVQKVLPEFAKNEKSIYHDRIEAILHQIELNFKKHKPEFGLGLLSSVLPTWVNGNDPIKSLQVEAILTKFKEDYESKGLSMFSELLNDSILSDSTPKFKFTMEPYEDFNKDLVQEEADRLARKTENLNEEDKEVIYKRSQKLLEKQQREEDVSVLPTLTLKDIARQGDFYPLEFSKFNNEANKIQKRIVDTNGLVYVTAAKDLSYLPEKYYKYLPLFNSCLTNLAGTTKTAITDLETKIQKLTGGVSFNISAKTDPYDIGKMKLKYVLSGMSLKDKSENIYDLWLEILNETKLDSNDATVIDKLNTLIKNLGQNQMNAIADRGHSYANSYNNSQLTVPKYFNDLTGGIAQVKFVMELNQRLEKEGKEFLANELLPTLREIRDLIVNGYTTDVSPAGGFNYNIVGDASIVKENEALVQAFEKNLSSANDYAVKGDVLSQLTANFSSATVGLGKNTLINLPYQVGYSSLAKLGSAYATKDGASLQVLSQILTFKHLHSVIREANGAYGGGLNFDGLGGTLNYYSYRDPNPIKSIESFKQTPEVALENLANVWDSKDLQEAKLAIFQSVDAPSHIASQGSSTFLDGVTDELRQERRERFLDVSISDLKDVAEKYLVPNKEVVTVIGDNEILKVDGSKWDVVALNTTS